MQNLMLIIYNLLSGLSDKPFESYDSFSLDHLFFFFFVHTFVINFVRVPPYKKFPKIFFCYFLYLFYSKFYADYESDIINLLFRSLNDKKTDFYLKNPLFTKKAILNITFFDF